MKNTPNVHKLTQDIAEAVGHWENTGPCQGEVRPEKVRRISEQIALGAYRIDFDKVAENMLGVFSDEFIGTGLGKVDRSGRWVFSLS